MCEENFIFFFISAQLYVFVLDGGDLAWLGLVIDCYTHTSSRPANWGGGGVGVTVYGLTLQHTPLSIDYLLHRDENGVAANMD